MKKYLLTAIAGTFDILHCGHRNFLAFALQNSEKIILGLTSDLYIEKNKPGRSIASFETRKKSLKDFFKEIGAQNRIEIVLINDKFGPAVNGDYLFDALFVTEETKKGGEKVNEKRVELGLLPLPLEVFKIITTDAGTPISSTMVRQEILLLSPTLRKLLQDPFGEILSVVPQDLDSNKIITVGDVTTKKFLDAGIQPFLAIIDNKIGRKDVAFTTEFDSKTHVVKMVNSAATINGEIFEVLKKIFGLSETQAVIIVDGEEDLLVLPTLLRAPLDFTVFYGQPHVGLVRVEVTREVRKKAQDLFDQFDTSESI